MAGYPNIKHFPDSMKLTHAHLLRYNSVTPHALFDAQLTPLLLYNQLLLCTGSNPPLQRAQAKEIYIMISIMFPFIFVNILILSVCIFCIFYYHYKTKNSVLGQKLRIVFARNSMRQRSCSYDYPGDKTSTAETIDNLNRDTSQLQTHDNVTSSVDQDDQTYDVIDNQLGSKDVTFTTDVRMQENTAYKSNVNFIVSSNPAYLTSVIATHKNVAYEQTAITMM